MRISDWSSDVCSSDLQPAISLATNFGYSQHAKRQGHGLPHLSARHAHQLQAASAQITNDAICMRDGRQDAARSGMRLLLPGEQINLQSERLRPANELRSEEHTSELQSLMRISYAVFCWKKKTKQTN